MFVCMCLTHVALHFCFGVCSYAQSVGAVHYSASAKQNKGVQELFLDLSKSEWMQLVTMQ